MVGTLAFVFDPDMEVEAAVAEDMEVEVDVDVDPADMAMDPDMAMDAVDMEVSADRFPSAGRKFYLCLVAFLFHQQHLWPFEPVRPYQCDQKDLPPKAQ